MKLDVSVDFCPTYQFSFAIAGLPGHYSRQGSFVFTQPSGAPMPAQWRQVFWTAAGDGQVVFNANLPLDFTGGTISAVDDLGQTYLPEVWLSPLDLDWDNMNFGDRLKFVYIAATANSAPPPRFCRNWPVKSGLTELIMPT